MEGIKKPNCSSCRIPMKEDKTFGEAGTDVIVFRCPNCGEEKKVPKPKQPVAAE